VDGTSLVKVLNSNNVTGASRLPTGRPRSGFSIHHFVTATGTEVRNFALPAGLDLRAINRDPATGNFWFSLTENVYEVTAQGAQVWTAFMGAGQQGLCGLVAPGRRCLCDNRRSVDRRRDQRRQDDRQPSRGQDQVPILRLLLWLRASRQWQLRCGQLAGAHRGARCRHASRGRADGGQSARLEWGNQTLARQITNVFIFR